MSSSISYEFLLGNVRYLGLDVQYITTYSLLFTEDN